MLLTYGGQTITYDASGMRTGKSVTSSTFGSAAYSYVYENGLLLQMRRGNRILDFSYDANGTPISVAYRSRATATPIYYYYGVNSRGDVVALYSSTGAPVAVYEYDAYGKLIAVENFTGVAITTATHIANMNPLRYRGYVYDNETGLYYLQSRYYDPTTCRFVNSDPAYISTGQDFNGYNMYTYCSNNPLAFSDYSGTRYIVSDSVANETAAQRSASCKYEIYGYSSTIIYDVPLYSQGNLNLCWAYSQIMIEDYKNNIEQSQTDADKDAFLLAFMRNGIFWNRGSRPKNMVGPFKETIEDLYYMLSEHGPLYASYGCYNKKGERVSGHAIVIIGVNVISNEVYTNNPWGISGVQSYDDFLNKFVGLSSQSITSEVYSSLQLDGYYYLY